MSDDVGGPSELKAQFESTTEDVAAMYDEWAENYDADLDGWDYEVPERIAALLVATGLPDGEVLDAGCGTGRSGAALRDAGVSDVLGVDVSPASLAVAERRGVYRATRDVDLTQPLPFADDRFAAVVCAGVLSYVVDVAATIEELVRVASPGGRVVLTHRSDLWDEQRLDDVLARIEGPAALTVSVSEPLPYLPGHTEFGDDIGVRHVTIDLPAAPAPPGAP